MLRFTNLGLQSLWFDEALTATVLDSSLGDAFETLRDREGTPPLYYSLAWLWTRVFGEGDAALRSLSALLGTLTVPAAYLAGARLASRRTGLMAAALVAASPYLIWYSQEARSYALAMLLAALSLAFLAGAAEDRSRRDLVLWSVTCVLLFATHYFSAILIAAEALWLVYRRGIRDRSALAAIALPGITALALLPLILSQQTADWIAKLDFQSRLDETPRFFLGGFGGAPGAGLGLAAGLLAAAGVALLLARARGAERRGGLLALGLAAAAIVASLVLALGGQDYVYHRNWLILWVPLAIAVAAGFASVRAVGIAGVAALCALSLVSHLGIVRDENRHRADWESAVNALEPIAGEARPVAIWPPYADAPLLHYGVPVVDRPDTTVRAREIVVIGEIPDVGKLEPGRRVGPFRVVGRRRDHVITTALLRARRPQPVELGAIDRGGNLGAPQFHVYMGTGAD